MLAELCLMAANEGVADIATSMDDCIGIELYWNASANECLDTCESGVYKRDNTNALVKICIAEADCTSKTFADGPLKECVTQCQFFDYTLEIDGKRYCYAYSCPSAYPVVGESGDCDTCRSVTNGKLPYWFGMAKKCVSKCPTMLSPSDGSDNCLSCMDAYSRLEMFDVVTQRCVIACPEKEFVQPDLNTCDIGCASKVYMLVTVLTMNGIEHYKKCMNESTLYRIE